MFRSLGRCLNSSDKIVMNAITKNIVHDNVKKTGASNIVLLPNDSKLAEKFKKQVAKGQIDISRYNEIHKTSPTDRQQIYSNDHAYRHTFVITELHHVDFLKKIGLIERQMTKKFGSTYSMRVEQMRPKFHKKWALLKSTHVNKKAQQHIDYMDQSYLISVSYAFNLTDPVLNDYVYTTLKNIVTASGGVKKFGYTIVKRPMRAIKVNPVTSMKDTANSVKKISVDLKNEIAELKSALQSSGDKALARKLRDKEVKAGQALPLTYKERYSQMYGEQSY